MDDACEQQPARPWRVHPLTWAICPDDLREDAAQEAALASLLGESENAAVQGLVEREMAWRDRRIPLDQVEPSELKSDPAPGLLDAAIVVEDREKLWSAVRRLPAQQQEAIEAIYVHGKTEAEAAEALGVSQVAVQKRLQRGLVGLRHLLGAS